MDTHQNDEPLFEVLRCAVASADAAIQATYCLWRELSPDQRDRWLEESANLWPRYDIFLKTLLPAAERILADESAA